MSYRYVMLSNHNSLSFFNEILFITHIEDIPNTSTTSGIVVVAYTFWYSCLPFG